MPESPPHDAPSDEPEVIEKLLVALGESFDLRTSTAAGELGDLCHPRGGDAQLAEGLLRRIEDPGDGDVRLWDARPLAERIAARDRSLARQ